MMNKCKQPTETPSLRWVLNDILRHRVESYDCALKIASKSRNYDADKNTTILESFSPEIINTIIDF